MRRYLLCLLFAVSASAATRSDWKLLLRPLVKGRNFSGAVLVARDGRVVSNDAFGEANVELSVPSTPDTKFYIGSISKSFTAHAILLLRDDGKLALDDPVSRFVPDFPRGEGITIRQLLRHESGLAQNTTSASYFEQATHAYSTEEAVAAFRNAPRPAAPGERRIYANPNYTLLALIAERASGQSFSALLSGRIFAPLHLRNTGNHTSWSGIVPRRAAGYAVTGESNLTNARYYDYSIGTGAGSLYSTTGDLFKWVQFVASRPELQDYAWSSRDVSGDSVRMAIGWDGAGFSAATLYDPARRIAVVVLSNMNVASMAETVALGVFASVTGKPSRLPRIDERPLPPATAAALAGHYRLGSDFYVPDTELDIVADGGMLFEQQKNGDRIALLRIGDREFLHRSSWGRIVFLDDGRLRFYDRFIATRT
jgi:CubicO group peptidase (beta-lactamase class C family)